MPWKNVEPMDEKILFVADYLKDDYSDFTQLCARYGVSRKTGYKWVSRYEQLGIEGLKDKSRRPLQSPLATPYVMRKAVIALRQRFQSPIGAKKIQALLAKQYSHEMIPSQTTIYHILRAEGLVKPHKKRQRVSPYPQPFAPAREANEVWSVDYKGQFKLGNGQWCYPLTVMDHDSRYLLDCKGLTGTGFKTAQRRFVRLFKYYGLPRRIRSDNGVPFASRSAGGLSQLSIWWLRLGILPERIKPGKPQQNGRHERMHRTLKKAVIRPPAANFQAQQRRFNRFIQEYNEQRPHEALNQTTPASHYHASARHYPETLSEMSYPEYFQTYTVRNTGVVYCHNGQVYISHLLYGEKIGMTEVADGVWDVYFGPIRLGNYDMRNKKGGSTPYWTINV